MRLPLRTVVYSLLIWLTALPSAVAQEVSGDSEADEAGLNLIGPLEMPLWLCVMIGVGFVMVGIMAWHVRIKREKKAEKYLKQIDNILENDESEL